MTTAFASSLIKYFELMAGITGLLCYYKKKNSIWFAFAVFLIFLYGLEELGSWLGRNKMYTQNTRMYKWLVIPWLFTMYHAVFYYITEKKSSLVVITSAIIFLLLALFENMFWGKEHYFSISLALSYGSFAVLCLSLIYFYQLLKSSDILHFSRLMPFWFCLGILIFYLGDFPYLTFFNSSAFSKNRDVFLAFRLVFILLNWLMYLIFTIGFLCSKPKL
jgi:hypothetical protein